jgi:hypothetical protein
VSDRKECRRGDDEPVAQAMALMGSPAEHGQALLNSGSCDPMPSITKDIGQWTRFNGLVAIFPAG